MHESRILKWVTSKNIKPTPRGNNRGSRTVQIELIPEQNRRNKSDWLGIPQKGDKSYYECWAKRYS